MVSAGSVFIVVPAFNEQGIIRATVRGLLSTGHQIVVVDDGSTDGTWSCLAGQVGVYRRRQAINLGQGAAIQTGTEYALARGAEYIVHFDADGQHRVADIDVLLAPLRSGEAGLALAHGFSLAIIGATCRAAGGCYCAPRDSSTS
jgi:glycosyltransferase involved in cell wall biosynthesis